jgi:hypothetical protein
MMNTISLTNDLDGKGRVYVLAYKGEDAATFTQGIDAFAHEIEYLSAGGSDDGKHDQAYALIEGELCPVDVRIQDGSARFVDAETGAVTITYNVIAYHPHERFDPKVIDTFTVTHY